VTRVLILTPSYPSPDNREAGIFIHRQVMGLVRQGLDCQVVHYRTAPPSLPGALRRRAYYRHKWHRIGRDRVLDGVPVKTVLFRAPADGADVVPAIAEAVSHSLGPQLGGADVIYAQWLWHAGAAALLLRGRAGLPVVTIARGSDLHQWIDTHAACRPWVERVLAEADQVLANCNALRERALTLRPPTPIAVVYNGCDVDRFQPPARRAEVRRRMGVAEEERLLVFCGSVEAHKGAAELTSAWLTFAARHPEWRLLVLGARTDQSLARRLAASPRVHMAGQIPEARVAAALQAADAFVQPSRAEGLANATMEAMATGLPVITTDAGGQREVVENGRTGWLVPVGDAIALSSALEALAADREEAWRRGREARRSMVERFQSEHQWSILAGHLRVAARGAVDPHPRAGATN
jgi:teichuronic acid biosynthesis glycosyltransferase TuaC